MQRFDFLVLRARVIVALWFDRKDHALTLLDGMVQAYPSSRYPVAARAHLLAQMRRPREAEADYRVLVTRYPADASAWFNLGFVLEGAEQWEAALDAFSHATSIDHQMDRAWYGQGLVLIRLQRLEEAAQALTRNTELQPMSPYGWYQLARVNMDRHQPDEAARIIRHLRGFEPKVAAQLERETGLFLGQPAS